MENNPVEIIIGQDFIDNVAKIVQSLNPSQKINTQVLVEDELEGIMYEYFPYSRRSNRPRKVRTIQIVFSKAFLNDFCEASDPNYLRSSMLGFISSILSKYHKLDEEHILAKPLIIPMLVHLLDKTTITVH